MKHRILVFSLLIIAELGRLPLAVQAQNTDPVFDVPALMAPPLGTKVLASATADGIVTDQVLFHSETSAGANINIFGYFSYPTGGHEAGGHEAGGRALPGLVWVQDGLTADSYFTTLGAKRGYATLCIDFPASGTRSTGAFDFSGGPTLPAEARQAPIYHGAVALLRAVSFLASRSEVDANRIGMAGSGWGGFFATLMAGVDPRLKAAASMYGCGGLQTGNPWWDNGPVGGSDKTADAALRERWRTTLDPAWRLVNSRASIAWFAGTDDHDFWMPALMHSYARASEPKSLTLLPNYDHVLTPELQEQVLAWLDSQLKGGPGFLKMSGIELSSSGLDSSATWHYSGPAPAVSAELLLSYGDDSNWAHRYWITLPATLQDGVCTAQLPYADIPMFIGGTVIDKRGFRYSTPLRRISKDDFPRGAVRHLIDYDGCAQWGGFEPAQIQFLAQCGLTAPPVTQPAYNGQQAAQLDAGETILPPIEFTNGVPHTLRMMLKSSAPANAQVTIAQTFASQTQARQTAHAIGTDWTQVTIPFTPRFVKAADMKVSIEIPAGVTMLLDDVSFKPVWPKN